MKRILISGFLFFQFGWAVAQQPNCSQTLRLARSTYDQGRLHELPGLVKGCLGDDGFTKQEKVEAYKLLTMAFLYLEEPEKADSSMLLLLKADPFFEINKEVDPQEFIGLYNTFRTAPIFSVGVKLGANISQPSASSNYYVGADSKGLGEYNSTIGLQFGLAFEKRLFQNSKKEMLRRFTLAPELLYVPRTFKYEVPTVFKNDNGSGSVAKFSAQENQAWLDLNVLLQYQLKKKSKLNPYVTLGPSIGYLLSGTRQQVLTRTSGSVTSGPDIEINKSIKQLIVSVVAGAGIKIKVGSVYLTGDVRYQFGLSNITSDTRTNFENTFDYGNQFNNYSINNIAVMIGGSKPIFNAKKKSHRK
jgi:outer membrane protein W